MLALWSYKGEKLKGLRLNIINMLYFSNKISIPVGFEIIKKNIYIAI